MNWMKFSLVAFIAVEVLQVVYLVRSRRNQNSRLFLQEKSEKMNEQLAFKDKQIEKEKEEKMILLAEKDKQLNKVLLLMQAFGKNAEKEMI